MPAFSLPTNLNSIEAWVGGLYGYAVGSQTMSQINADITSYGSLGNTLNTYYASAFGAMPTANVAANIVANVGLGTDANAIAYVTGQLNSAPANARGVAVLNILNAFSGMTGDKTYGSAAATWNATVSNSVTYANQNAADALLTKAATVVATAAAAPSTTSLTSGIDNIAGNPAGNNVINGADAVVGTSTQPTFTPGDNIALTGTGNVLNWITTAQITGTPAGATVSGVQTVNATSSGNATLSLDVSKGWSGLTQLNVTNSATATTAATGDSVSITAPSTTNINATSANTLTAGAISTFGGQGVSATLINSGVNAGIAANIGTLTQPAGNGPVIVSNTEAIVGAASATYTAGGTTTNGGSTVSITQNIAPDSASAGTIATGNVSTIDAGGAIKVYGTTNTTSVTVTQTPQSGALASGTVAVGYTGVAGVVDGAVTIQDVNYASGTAAGKITSVSLTNYGAGSTITSSGLNTLTIGATSVSSPVPNSPGYTASSSTSNTNNGTLSVVNPLATTPVTALTLNLTGGASNLITFSGAGTSAVTTLNVVAQAATSTAPITGGQFTTINISGTGVAALGSSNSASAGGNNGFNAGADAGLTALNVTGAAGFSDGNGAGSRSGLNTFGSALTINNAGTGKFTAYIDDTTQSYVAGVAGTSVITVNADATKPVTAGSGAADEIIFAAAPTLTAAGSGTNITGFEIFGVGVGATGSTFDMSKFAADKFTTIDAAASSSAGTYTFKNVTGNVLNIGTTSSGSNNVTYTVADANGAADSLTVNLGSTSAASGTVASYTSTLAVSDASNQGIGTMVINANISTATGTPTNTVETINLTNTGLSNLTINGGAGVTIAGAQTISSPTLNIVNNSSAANTDGSTWTTDGFSGAISDTILSTISYSGSHNFGVTGGITTSSPVLNVTNTNTGTTGVLALGTVTDTSLVSINLKGSISGTFAPTIAAGNSFTLNGGTDNSNVSVTLTNGAGATLTDNITLGNGSNTIVDPSTAGSVNITTGTGVNKITVGTASNTTGSYNVNVGYHTSADTFTVGSGGSYVSSAPNTVINGALTGDIIILSTESAGTAATPINNAGAPSTTAAIPVVLGGGSAVVESAYVASSGVTLIGDTSAGAAKSLIQLTGKQLIAWEGTGFANSTGVSIGLSATGTGTVPTPTATASVKLPTHTAGNILSQTVAFVETIGGFDATLDKLTLKNSATELNGLAIASTGHTGLVAAGTAATAVVASTAITAAPHTINTTGANILNFTKAGGVADTATLLGLIKAGGADAVTFGGSVSAGEHFLVEYDDNTSVHIALLTQGTAGAALAANATLADIAVITGTTHLTASNFTITAS